MLQGILVKKVLDLVMKQVLKQFNLDKIQKYVEQPNELDMQVKSLQKSISKYGKSIEELNPMTIELNPKVRASIPKIIDNILSHSKELYLKKA